MNYVHSKENKLNNNYKKQKVEVNKLKKFNNVITNYQFKYLNYNKLIQP